MPGRTRTRNSPIAGQNCQVRFQTNAWVPYSGRTNYLTQETCTDVIGSRHTDNPLSLQKLEVDPGLLLSGSTGTTAGWQVQCQNWATNCCVTSGHLSVSNISNGAMATQTLSRSNPSRPSVGLPVFIAELRDLPGMIRDIGNIKRGLTKPGVLSRRDIANHYLAGQMGWVPLVSDLRKLFAFRSAVDKRVAELDRLFNHNEGLHRTVGKPNPRKGIQGSNVVSVTSNGTTQDTVLPPYILTWKYDKITTSTKWGSVRWTSSLLPRTPLTDKELRKIARILVLGLDDPRALWDILPWSWLIDWFANVGDFIEAHHNNLPLSPSTPCIMETVQTKVSFVRTSVPSQLKGGSGTITLTNKTRVTSAATLSASFPVITGRQFSILGGLAIQRLR